MKSGRSLEDKSKVSDSLDIRAEFGRVGVYVVRKVLPANLIASLDQECDRLWQSQKNRTVSNLRLGLRENELGDVILDQIDPVEDISETFKQLNRDPRLTKLATTILQEPVTVLKEKLLYKLPGTSGFGLHRDVNYYQSTEVKGQEVVTAAVAIDDMTDSSGAVVFYPDLRFRETRAPASDERDVDEKETIGCTSLSYELSAGDILLFDGLVPHCSDFNRSDASRRVYYITYVPARYTDGRQRYYRQRLREQEIERQGLVDGECRFD